MKADEAPHHDCDAPGCMNEGQAVWLPDLDGTGQTQPDGYYCSTHAHVHGFCWGCGDFWGGCEDFDFSANGLCSNCRDNPDITGYEPDDENDEEAGWYEPEEAAAYFPLREEPS